MVSSASLYSCYCFTIFEKYRILSTHRGLKNSMWTDLISQALIFQLPVWYTVSSVVMRLACQDINWFLLLLCWCPPTLGPAQQFFSFYFRTFFPFIESRFFSHEIYPDLYFPLPLFLQAPFHLPSLQNPPPFCLSFDKNRLTRDNNQT